MFNVENKTSDSIVHAYDEHVIRNYVNISVFLDFNNLLVWVIRLYDDIVISSYLPYFNIFYSLICKKKKNTWVPDQRSLVEHISFHRWKNTLILKSTIAIFRLDVFFSSCFRNVPSNFPFEGHLSYHIIEQTKNRYIYIHI